MSVYSQTQPRSDKLPAEFERAFRHDESHVGPYGVEMPLFWDHEVTVTQTSSIIKPGDIQSGGKDSSHVAVSSKNCAASDAIQRNEAMDCNKVAKC